MPQMALLFARKAGVEPRLDEWPDLARALLFGPLTPVSFRLSGRDALPDAAELVARDAAEFGAVCGTELTPGEHRQVRALAAAHPDPSLRRLAEILAPIAEAQAAHAVVAEPGAVRAAA